MYKGSDEKKTPEKPKKEPGVKSDPVGAVNRLLLAQVPGTPICKEAQTYIAKMRTEEGQLFAIKLLRNFDNADDQLREVRNLMGFPAPERKLSKKQKAEQDAKLKEYEARLPELERMAAKNRFARAVKHNAEVLTQYQTSPHSGLLSLNEALIAHDKAPDLEPAMTAATLHALGLTHPQANGVFLLEVENGVARGCWQLRPNLERLSFFTRVKLAFRLAFGFGLGPSARVTSTPTPGQMAVPHQP